MLGAFGQIPINDFMIGKMARATARARIYGVRYVVSFTVLAAVPAADRLRLRELGLRHAVPADGECGRRDLRGDGVPAITAPGSCGRARLRNRRSAWLSHVVFVCARSIQTGLFCRRKRSSP